MPNLEDELWLCERRDGVMTQQEVKVLDEAGNDRSLWRAAALCMVIVQTLQQLSTTTEMPASDGDRETLPSNRCIRLSSSNLTYSLHSSMLTFWPSPISNQLVSFTISVSIWISSTPQNGLHTNTQLVSVRPSDCRFMIAYVYFILLLCISKRSSS